MAFYYWPGIFTDKFKIKEMKLIDDSSDNKAGEILEITKQSIIVGCKKGKIEIFKIQSHSKKEMDVISYINGQRLKVGDNLL